MKIILIASVSKNYVIGNLGQLPWSNKTDLLHFKKTTSNNIVLMGRKTYDSIGKALSNIMNIILSRKENDTYPNQDAAIWFSNIKDAISYAQESKFGDLYIIGGGEIFKQTIDFADELIISHMPYEVKGDIYFPKINPEVWHEINRVPIDNFHVSYYSKRN